jgi:hypothetical protein
MDLHDAINHHLELRERNAGLEARLPLADYRGEPIDTAPAPARQPVRVLEETQEHAPAWLAAPESEAEGDDWVWEDD